MKNDSFVKRLGYAISGIFSALRTESSFRLQTVAAFGMIGFMCWLRPTAIWWALVILTCGAVLGAELINTALERIVDHLHPETHPAIKIAKDCAAGAVLVLSLMAIAVFIALLIANL